MMAEELTLSVSDCDVFENFFCPNTPESLSVAEVTEALPNPFCQQVSVEQFEEQGTSETERALNDLIAYMEKDPSVFKKVLESRKKYEMGQKGIVSYLKTKILSKITGDQDAVTEHECAEKVEEVTNGIIMVFNNAQEAQGRRFSKRLALKRQRQSVVQLDSSPKRPLLEHRVFRSNIPALRDQTNTFVSANEELDAQKLKRQPIHRQSDTSTPLKAVHSELLSNNRNLKVTFAQRSPGGTPVRNLDDSLHWKNPFNTPEPLSSALFRIMETKFHNIRSPSPSTCSDVSCQSDGFTD